MLLSERPSKRQIIFAVDIGTTNIRCFAYDNFANVLGKADEMVPVLNVGGDEHEIDPVLLWNAFQRVVKKCLECCHLNAEDVSCLGISSQRGTFLTWDRETSVPFHNFITWKDKRAESNCNSWNSSFSMKMFRFGAFLLYMVTRKKKFQVASVFKLTSSMVLMRLSWVLENVSKVREKLLQRNVLFGTLDTWLIWKLTQGKVHATDGSNASVTGFFDPFQMQWADWILKMFNIPADILPEVKNTCDHFGDTSSEIFGASIPIYAVVGDQQASMFGSCCFEKYDINCTMGTGSFLNMNTGCTPSAAYNGVYPLVGWTIFSRTTYVAECGVHDSGTIISWAQKLGLFEEPHESSIIAQSVTDSGGVYFLPFPDVADCAVEENSRSSAFVGIKIQTSKQQLVRSVLEALAFQVCLLFDYMMRDNLFTKNKVFRISGGVSKNDFIVQLISDLTRKPIHRLNHSESSSLGAAFLAGLYCGIWKNQDELSSLKKASDCFVPNIESNKNYYKAFLKWKVSNDKFKSNKV